MIYAYLVVLSMQIGYLTYRPQDTTMNKSTNSTTHFALYNIVFRPGPFKEPVKEEVQDF